MAIDITVSQAQGRLPVTILQPHGELDASNYKELIAEAQRVYDDGVRDILLDLGDVSYMSSSGLVALQSMASLLRGQDLPDLESGWGTFHALDRDREMGLQTRFKLCSPQPRVDQVLEMVGFKRFLEVYVDRETAIASF
jgi:anti-anti-sigma factor